jgi:hypothetical protein
MKTCDQNQNLAELRGVVPRTISSSERSEKKKKKWVTSGGVIPVDEGWQNGKGLRARESLSRSKHVAWGRASGHFPPWRWALNCARVLTAAICRLVRKLHGPRSGCRTRVWVCVVLTVCWQDNGQGKDGDANTMGQLDRFGISAS